ncbi:MAG: UvrD-helicase domain-containing protein [Formosimonas sp.]
MIKAFEWTSEQVAIFEPAKWGNAIISACAGSGKSTTIIERCVRHTARIQPWQSIALISFTNKSAQDLRNKLQAKGGVHSQIESSTFHVFLKRHVLGFDERFRGRKLPFTYSNKQSSLDNWLAYFVQNGKIPFAAQANDDFLFEHALSLIKSKPQLRRYLQAKFHAVYIDEAQDNNHWQYDIVDELMGLGLECVLIGDSSQTIFGFRGADPDKFNALSNDQRFIQSGGVFHLLKNHRCNARIDFWANQTDLPMQGDYDENTKHGVFRCPIDFLENKSADHERLKTEGFAVLVQSNRQLESLPAHIKVVKTPELVEQSDNPELTANLYRLALLGQKFSEYHFYDAVYTDETTPVSFISKLRVFNQNPNAQTLQALNSVFPVLRSEQIDNFIESLKDEEVTGFFRHNPLCDQIAMTIHSAKGLEFNNVFVYANDFLKLNNQNIKRLHYVAFTRAKNRLIVLN